MTTTDHERYDADVAIIGAGPAGMAAAIRLAQLGVARVLLVDGACMPVDKGCGGALSPRGIKALKALGVWDKVAAQAYPLSGVRVVTHTDRELYLSGALGAAVVCRRTTLDAILDAHLRALAVTVWRPCLATQLLHESDGRVRGFVAADGREVRAKYTLVATGADTDLALPAAPAQPMHAIMGRWEKVPFKAHHAELVFDEMLSPQCGWLFPEHATRVAIGICYASDRHASSADAHALFTRFLDKHYRHRLSSAVQIGAWKHGPVSRTTAIQSLGSPGRLVIGEAGRMTHPATGEGISFGLHTGMLAARALSKVLQNGLSEVEALADYEAACRKAFTWSFLGAKVFQRMARPKVLDAVASVVMQRHVKKAMGRMLTEM